MTLTVPVSGRFWRITFADRLGAILDGAQHPEGRYHHGAQAAFYASPTPEFTAMAVDIYVKPGDAPRVITPLILSNANLCDMRDPEICHALGVDPDAASVQWVSERAAGLPATSWTASDAVREINADGMIYRARNYPDRWHIVLFHWNELGRAALKITGKSRPWSKA